MDKAARSEVLEGLGQLPALQPSEAMRLRTPDFSERNPKEWAAYHPSPALSPVTWPSLQVQFGTSEPLLLVREGIPDSPT